MKMIRWILRIAMLSIVAALFIALAGMWARSIQPDFRNEREANRIVRRALWPQAHRFPSVVADIVIIGLIAFGGRVILRLRLSSRAAQSRSNELIGASDQKR